MKVLIFNSILILSMTLAFSCSKDNDDMGNMNFEELIIGQWKRTAVTLDGENSTSACATDFKVTFGDSGNYGESPFDGSTCTSTGNTGSYTISGSEISVASAFFSATYEISSLNTNSLVYSYESQSGVLNVHTYTKI